MLLLFFAALLIGLLLALLILLGLALRAGARLLTCAVDEFIESAEDVFLESLGDDARVAPGAETPGALVHQADGFEELVGDGFVLCELAVELGVGGIGVDLMLWC